MCVASVKVRQRRVIDKRLASAKRDCSGHSSVGNANVCRGADGGLSKIHTYENVWESSCVTAEITRARFDVIAVTPVLRRVCVTPRALKYISGAKKRL